MTLSIIFLGILLAVKHFLADGLWQTTWHYKNKGIFMHPGGLAHSANHALGTLIVIALWGALTPYTVSIIMIVGLAVFDFITHYMIDYSKVNLTKNKGYSAMGEDKSGTPCQLIYDNKFYWWLVADQCAHFSVYTVIIAAVVGLQM